MEVRRSLPTPFLLLLASLALQIIFVALAAETTGPASLETCTAASGEAGAEKNTCANVPAAAAAAESAASAASDGAGDDADAGVPTLALTLETARAGAEGAEPEGERRVVQLSAWSPRAYLFKRFLSEEECDHIVAQANPRLQRSSVVDGVDGHVSVSQVRTSSGMFMEKGEDEVIKRIEERIAVWTFLPLANQESLQVLRYGVGQKYDAHHDYFDDPKHLQRGGHRYATVLMYLNNVTKGGETTFPMHKDPTPKDDSWSDCAQGVLGVKPIKGDALLFFNMLPDGSPDESSLHHACPVVEGEKWSAPKWIHVGSFDEPAAQGGGACVDSNAFCEAWAEMGECERNKDYMIGSKGSPGACRKSCKVCSAEGADEAEGAAAEGASDGDDVPAEGELKNDGADDEANGSAADAAADAAEAGTASA
ncbi:hypothetical protein CLOM_g9241 [Closterium sp. NIES-68]|nr:hypothetical protein CLOM_g20242 [Closterium sp. NIES-68]GJP50100.1 hypothetical protein CLOM_g9241 [Closterium sp. NIES-68]GJP61394.1 hypothetical protein CLOP_g18562 [Closterium sp. NIES-67]